MMLSDISAYDGYRLQAYLLENIDLIGYCASFYLVMVGKGSTILSWVFTEKAHATSKRQLAGQLSVLYSTSFLLHVVLAVVSLACAACLAQMLLQRIVEDGFYSAACAWDESLIYLGLGGLAMSIITLSKIGELLTTVSYAIRDALLGRTRNASTAELTEMLVQTHNTVSPPHWWYHTLISLYFWHSYSVGPSTLPMMAVINAALRSISNAAMAVEDVSMRGKLSMLISGHAKVKKGSEKRSAVMKLMGVLPVAAMLTECVLCAGVALYSGYMSYTADQGCNVMRSNVRMCVLMYVIAFVLAVYQLSNVHKAPTASAAVSAKKQQ